MQRFGRYHRRPVAAAIAAVATMCALAACGHSASPSDQVRDAWSGIKAALASGDAQKLCSLLSDRASVQLLSDVSQVASSDATCTSAATTLFSVSRNARSKVAHAKLLTVTVHGNHAQTTDSTGPPADEWTKVGASWELADLN